MQYMWWADEDYRENDFELLTPKDVNEHFLGNIRLFNHIEETCDNYNDPEILEEYVGYSLEDFNKAEIDKLINEWIEEFAVNGIELSYEDVKPLIDNFKFGTNRHLIVENPKGYFVFSTYLLKKNTKKDQQSFDYQFLPKFEECKEWLENIKKSHS